MKEIIKKKNLVIDINLNKKIKIVPSEKDKRTKVEPDYVRKVVEGLRITRSDMGSVYWVDFLDEKGSVILRGGYSFELTQGICEYFMTEEIKEIKFN